MIGLPGSAIVTVTAEDADAGTGSTAPSLITYSLQRNVVEEHTGQAIFSVDALTGAITTAVCCLDREHTGRYILLLAASDQGGLQGTSVWCLDT